MRHEKVNVRTKMPRYEQARFGGIEQGKALGDESIYDLFDISPDDFPILSTVDNRRQGSDKYDNPIYYGMADKPFVIAGSGKGVAFGLFKSKKAYGVGAKVLYAGDIYECIYQYGDTDSNADAVPAANSKNWRLYKNNTFSYDGSYVEGTKFRANNVYYYGGKWYICKKEHEYSADTNPSVNTDLWEPYSCTFFYYNGKKIDGIQLIPGKKTCSYLNGKICIFPDKVYYDVTNGKFGHMKGNYSGYYPYTHYKGEAEVNGYYENIYIGGRKLSWALSDSSKFIEGATGRYDTLSLWWMHEGGQDYASSHGNINLKNIFSAGDIVHIENGSSGSGETLLVEGYYIIREVGEYYLRFDSQTFAGLTLKNSFTSGHIELYYLSKLKLNKDVPDMDMLCVSQNRMWGAKDNTVYACALGNCLSWQSYTGLETDAVAFDCGTVGNFISCTEYGNYPVFFKENEFYRVYGNTVSEYSLTRIASIGVDKDSPYSVAEINSTLIMHSPSGIYAYSGGIPSIISDNFKGNIKSCIASTDGFKYYAMATIDGRRRLYVYDLAKRIWTSESGLEVIGFITYENCLRCLTQSGVEVELSGNSDWGTVESDVTEEAIIEFNDFYGGGVGHKEVSRIIVRASVEPRYNPLHIYIQYDSDGMWHRVMKVYNQNNRKKIAEAGFALRKCDHFRLRFVCQGKFSLYSVAREYIDE